MGRLLAGLLRPGSRAGKATASWSIGAMTVCHAFSALVCAAWKWGRRVAALRLDGPRPESGCAGGWCCSRAFQISFARLRPPCGRSDRSIRAALSILFAEFADYTFVLV